MFILAVTLRRFRSWTSARHCWVTRLCGEIGVQTEPFRRQSKQRSSELVYEWERAAHRHRYAQVSAALPPLGHIWDAMLVWRNGEFQSLCYSIVVHNGTSSYYTSVDWIRLWSCVI